MEIIYKGKLYTPIKEKDNHNIIGISKNGNRINITKILENLEEKNETIKVWFRSSKK